MKPALDKSLAAAVAGLMYPSESDAPLAPFRWSHRGDDAEQAAVRSSRVKSPVETVAFEAFFEPLLRSSEGSRYAGLRQIFRRRLKDSTVVRVGSVRVTIYIMGRQGTDWVGVWTVSTET